MKVIVSAAVSIDGYLDDTSPERLVLSGAEDWAEIHRLRAECDAILVGAETLRKDNPALVIRDSVLRAERIARGQNPDQTKVTLSRTGRLSSDLRFFTEGEGEKVVFLQEPLPSTIHQLAEYASIISVPQLTASSIVNELERRGCHSLLIEGGSQVLDMFFKENRVDEFRLAIAPFFVGESGAPRLVHEGAFPFDKEHRMTLLEARKVGDMAVMHYKLEP